MNSFFIITKIRPLNGRRAGPKRSNLPPPLKPVFQTGEKQTATTSHVMAVWYLSEHPTSRHLLPQGLCTPHLSLTRPRIEGSGLALLFLSFALVDIAA